MWITVTTVIEPVGQAALREMLELRVPPPLVESFISSGSRRTEVRGHRAVEYFPAVYRPEGSIVSQIRFALTHEAFDLSVMVAVLKAIDPSEITSWVKREPTGAYSRRAWFLYETFTGRALDLEPTSRGNYVDALDPRRHYVARAQKSPRHRVNDNLLGSPAFCPTVRRTKRLDEYAALRLDEEASSLAREYDPVALARAVSYLYTKETRSSFAIEGETPGPTRAARFVSTLRSAASFDPADKPALIRLQNAIVDTRYAENDWRAIQNFVGEVAGGYRDVVHFVPPKPDDLPDLMTGWAEMTKRLLANGLDPVVAAAVVAFGFVFVHPFEDGNGRIHRFLIHNALTRRGFGPPGAILPVSASILRQRESYDAALEAFSKPLAEYVDWRPTPDGVIAVDGDTADLYRYFDATPQAEYLYERVADTVRHDLREELDYVTTYDRALAAIASVVDMPDRRASLFVRLCLQNRGKLAQGRREQFPELTDEEVERMEAAIQEAMTATGRTE